MITEKKNVNQKRHVNYPLYYARLFQALTSLTNLHHFLTCVLSFSSNALWLVAHVDIAREVPISRRRTKRADCVPTANCANHLVFVV